MKWFIECLRHYADFSGRARRREYWLFTLFYVIFMFVWAFLVALMVMSRNYDEQTLPLAIQLMWTSFIALPGLAAVVRRLHDTGRSGWWWLITLIPFVGGIWMLVLLCLDGQTGPNRFGPDPKTTPRSFPDRAKLRSAGVVIIVAASLGLLRLLCSTLLPGAFYSGDLLAPQSITVQSFILVGAILAAGILIVRARDRERMRPGLWILLAVCGYYGLRGLPGLYTTFGMIKDGLPLLSVFSNVVNVLMNLSIALVVAFALFAPQNRKWIRGMAAVAVTMGFLWLVQWLLISKMYGFYFQNINDTFIMLGAVTPISWIVLAWTLASRTEKAQEVSAIAEPAVDDSPAALLDEGEALIHIYRPGRMAGAMIGYDVYLDDNPVWRAKNGSRTTIRLTTGGAHTVMAKTEVRREVTLDVVLGCEYYIRCGMKMGAMVGRPDLQQVDPAVGKTEFDKIS
jgi:uncharacterized membrane protein YhaH (DUF805 family)